MPGRLTLAEGYVLRQVCFGERYKEAEKVLLEWPETADAEVQPVNLPFPLGPMHNLLFVYGGVLRYEDVSQDTARALGERVLEALRTVQDVRGEAERRGYRSYAGLESVEESAQAVEVPSVRERGFSDNYRQLRQQREVLLSRPQFRLYQRLCDQLRTMVRPSDLKPFGAGSPQGVYLMYVLVQDAVAAATELRGSLPLRPEDL